jgi:formimidoylglutamate deiminase
MTTKIWAASALLPDGWADAVEITIDDSGNIASVRPDSPQISGHCAEVLLPAIPNVHSHAHQRAMAGLGERAGNSDDSFWTWRKVMYHYLERIQPEQLKHIAAQLYIEMLKSGYSCVGEFQYLHHGVDGKAYANPAEMSLQCLEAARAVGIGFTALPVLYRYGGFGSAGPLDGQKRFINDADSFIDIVERLQQACVADANTAVGIAPHSLRAIDHELLSTVIDSLDDLAAIHIHIAEQTGEVDDCLAWCGQRPVAWLLDNFAVDAKWCLIHATHMDAAETADMAASGCAAGLCPTTEANLGDGFFNAVDYLARGGRWAIGSDSHISIDPVEELRWLEYGMRLQTRRRNVLSSTGMANTGRSLFDGAVAGGAQACGRAIGRIAPGYRGDLLTLDCDHPRLYGRSGDELIDSWIFSGNENLVRDVYVGGLRLVENGRHADEDMIARNYRDTLDQLGQET